MYVNPINRMQILGPVFCSLSCLQDESRPWSTAEFAAAAARCWNAAALDITASLPIVNAFFRLPKPKLTKLHLSFSGLAADCSAVVDRIAENTGGLRDLCLIAELSTFMACMNDCISTDMISRKLSWHPSCRTTVFWVLVGNRHTRADLQEPPRLPQCIPDREIPHLLRRAYLSTMSAGDEPKTFLTDLPNKALVNILRFFSDFPHQRNWIVHLSSSVLVNLAHEKHPLRIAAQDTVTELSLRSNHDEPTLRVIFETYGSRCSSLIWDGQLVHDFNQNNACISLKKLQVMYSIRSVDDALLSLISVQRNLEELELRNSGILAMPEEVLSEIMQREKKEYLKVVKCLTDFGAGLKRLDMSIFLDEDAAFSRMFNVLGPTLESLKLSIQDRAETDVVEPLPSRFSIRSLADLCPNVTEIEINVHPLDSEPRDATHLYCAYGKQLKVIHVSGYPPAEDLRQVGTACTNATFDVDLLRHNPTDCMQILGPAIRSLTFKRCRCMQWSSDDFASAAARCCNVETLDIRAGMEAASEFFRNPKPKLVKLGLSASTSATDYEHSALIGSIAENTGSLRDLCLTGPVIETEQLQKLVDANRNIESANFPHHDRRTGNAQENESLHSNYVADCVSVFSKCVALRHLSFYGLGAPPQPNYAAVADACVPLRLQNVSVNHNRTEYL